MNGSGRLLAVGLLLLLSRLPLPGQRNLAGTAEIKLALERLRTVGSVLMIAAHPDDENTALLAYCARGRHVRTGYLSLTRGEGGQNLIGSEQGDLMGVIRTEELLAARRIDGGEQFFTRAIDFGFSKSANETLSKWGREQVLADMVWVIRKFRPDVILLRFSGTPRDGHGHHQGSAILAREAFAAAADPSRFPDQLKTVAPWQARRMMFNIFAFTREQEAAAAATPGRVEIDTGTYDPVLGYSYSEIAGMSRSQHRSQGMGAPERRGSRKDSLVPVAGEAAKSDIFEGIDLSWSRVDGQAVAKLLDRAVQTFDPSQPHLTAPLLLEARALAAALPSPEARRKLPEFDEAVALCTGLWLDASADRPAVVTGSSVKVNVTAVNRSPLAMTLESVALEGIDGVSPAHLNSALANNVPLAKPIDVSVPETQPYSEPYWLTHPKDGALYHVPDPALLGLAESPPPLRARFRLKTGEHSIELVRAVHHRYVDRVLGELTRPLAFVPPVVLRLPQSAMVFPDGKAATIEIEVRANQPKADGDVRLGAPHGWSVDPQVRRFHLGDRGEQTLVTFKLTPPATESRGELRAIATVGKRELSSDMQIIDYPHIPVQTLFPPAAATLVRADIRTTARQVGYVMGAGDDVPQAIAQLGCHVTLLDTQQLARGDLSRFDAIVTGVRAYNTRPDLRANQQRLLDYVAAGGTMIAQYNVLEGGFMGGDPSLLAKIGPYPITIGRDRVSVEEAPIHARSAHPLLTAPNTITSADFGGWVQERGLYFASKWDPRYETVFESNDPGEKPLAGGILYVRHGKGVYIFTAYSWFRQLPAGVPGAFRIFANMLSAGTVAR